MDSCQRMDLAWSHNACLFLPIAERQGSSLLPSFLLHSPSLSLSPLLPSFLSFSFYLSLFFPVFKVFIGKYFRKERLIPLFPNPRNVELYLRTLFLGDRCFASLLFIDPAKSKKLAVPNSSGLNHRLIYFFSTSDCITALNDVPSDLYTEVPLYA